MPWPRKPPSAAKRALDEEQEETSPTTAAESVDAPDTNESKGTDIEVMQQSTKPATAQDVRKGTNFFLDPPDSRKITTRSHFKKAERPTTGWTRRSSIASEQSAGSAFSIEGIAEFLNLDWEKRGAMKDRVVEGLTTVFAQHYEHNVDGKMEHLILFTHNALPVSLFSINAVLMCSAGKARSE